MGLQIADTFLNIDQCFDNDGFNKISWRRYISQHLPYAKEAIEKDASEYDFDKEVLPILNAVKRKYSAAADLHDVFVAVCDGLEERIREKLNTEINAVVVLYLGLCNGAGWAVSFSGVPHVLLGIEKIMELDWCSEAEIKGLLYHELGHIWHDQCTADCQKIDTMKKRALWQLYREGIAMYCEQLLCENDNFYHQDKNGWLSWCGKNKTALFKEYVRVIENQESHQKFFGDWCNYLGVSDTGYYLGCELIKKALKTRSVSHVLNLDLSEVEAILYACAEEEVRQRR